MLIELWSKGGTLFRALASHHCGWIQILVSTSYVDRVCCWFSPLLWKVFLSVPGMIDKALLCGCAISKLLFLYLFMPTFLSKRHCFVHCRWFSVLIEFSGIPTQIFSAMLEVQQQIVESFSSSGICTSHLFLLHLLLVRLPISWKMCQMKSL